MQIVHETITRNLHQSLGCLRQDLVAFDCPYHRHPEFEIVRIDESRGRLLVGDYAGMFQPGDLYLFAGTLPHAFINDEDTQRARSTCLQFDPALLESSMAIWPELSSIKTVLALSRQGICLKASKSTGISEALDQVFEKTGVAQISELLRLFSLVKNLERHSLLASEGYKLRNPDRQIARLEKVVGCIHEQSDQRVSVDQLAELAGMSVSSFHDFFRKRMGYPPGVYILNLRFSEIAHRLLESEDTISEIAFSSGFNNLSNFNRQFQKRFGCSPSGYRKQLQSADEASS